MRFIIAAAIILMLVYLIPSLVLPVAKRSMSEAPFAGDLAIIAILMVGAAIILGGLVGIISKRT